MVVYAELRDEQGRALEAWLPASPGLAGTTRRPLYAPAVAAGTGTRNAASAAPLLVVAGLVVACLRLARRSARG